VIVLTGSGLKDPEAALSNVEPPIHFEGDARALAKALKL
jgi:threonine synthase